MWFAIPLVVLILFGLIGGVLLGGVFTLVLVPLAILGTIATIGGMLWVRATEGSSGAASASIPDGLPHSARRNTAPAPSTPGDLADARRQQQ
jgi:hypothetical protein